MVIPTNISAALTWDPPLDTNGLISSYNITLTDDTNVIITMITVLRNLELNFTDLRPFTNYTVSIEPFTDSDTIGGIIAEEVFTTDIGSEYHICYK